MSFILHCGRYHWCSCTGLIWCLLLSEGSCCSATLTMSYKSVVGTTSSTQMTSPTTRQPTRNVSSQHVCYLRQQPGRPLQAEIRENREFGEKKSLQGNIREFGKKWGLSGKDQGFCFTILSGHPEERTPHKNGESLYFPSQIYDKVQVVRVVPITHIQAPVSIVCQKLYV